MSSQQASTTEPQDVEAYFTDVEQLLEAFENAVAAPTLTKRLFIIHGVGGVGKSSLLLMFRLHCKSVRVPVALASGDDAKSAVDVFYRHTETGDERGWVPDLKADGIALPTFAKTFEHYRAIQAKVDAQAKKDAGTRAMDIAGKAASKTAEAAGGAVMGAAIGSLVPGIGTAAGAALGGALGGMSAEAFVDWLKTVLKLGKPDIDLLLDPAKKLSEDFLTDLAKIAPTKRIALMLDTYEQMAALDDWAREIAQRMHPNVLLVIAGRVLPNWSDAWHGWMAHAYVEELKPMSEDDMRTLVRRYYATIRGGEPDAAQVDAIVRFARGLPIVVTSAVELWVQYGVEDFVAIKPQVVADLVDVLLEGVPSAMIPALEAAATVRWFNKEILRAVTQQTDVNAVYNELRRFPFARSRAEGFMLHDTVREMMDENLKVQDPERHRELHERAAVYFENLVKGLKVIPGLSDEWQRLSMEEAYHLLRVREDDGMDILHKLFEQGFAYFRYQFCQTLLNDAESLPVSSPKSVHRLKYNKIRLKIAEFSGAYVSDEEFKELVEKSDLDPATKWEVLLNYAWFVGFTAVDYKKQAGYYRKSLDALRAIGQEESAAGCVVLAAVASSYGDEPAKKEELAKQALAISQKIGEPYFAYGPYVELGHLYLDTGEYAKAEEMWRAAVEIGQRFQNDARIADALNRLAHALMAMGRLSETEEVLNSAMEAAKRLPDTLGAGRDKEMYIKRHFGILYQIRGEYDKAIQYYFESAETYRQRRSIGGRLRTLVLLANCLYEAGRRHDIEQLSPEATSLVPKLKASEIVAGWLVVQGHMLLDDMLEHKVQLDDVVAKYHETLITALESHHIVVLDEMVNRILWKLGLIIAGKEQEVVLQGLFRFWARGKIGTKPLVEEEDEQRQKFIGPARETRVLAQFESALTQGIPRRKPSPWLSY